MIKLIDSCLRHYHYMNIKEIPYENLWFYKNTDKSIASYFLIYHIDCTSFESDSEKMKYALGRLETHYSIRSGDSNSIKAIVQNLLESTQEASQIDKNTSAIYLVKFNDIRNLDMHRNLVYAIEESPNYFKRYILPYTQEQIDGLKKVISDHSMLQINEILSDIANDEDEYYKLMDGQNIGSVYELSIRLFSKIPFLQYRFTASSMPKPIEEEIAQKVKQKDLTKYHIAIETKKCSLEDLLALAPDTLIKDEVIDRELEKILGGAD